MKIVYTIIAVVGIISTGMTGNILALLWCLAWVVLVFSIDWTLYGPD